MHTQKKIISDTQNKKNRLDILSVLPLKKTRDTLKTQMLRVDHAGEFGAVHIYRGQTNIFQSAPDKYDIFIKIQEMGNQEKAHLDTFNKTLSKRRIRPTLLSPLWQIGGFSMGAMTAIISEKSAMACTEAVETVIDKHYETQINYFASENPVDILLCDLKQFQQDELAHKHEAIENDSANAPFYKTTKFLIETICHSVIKLAHKI